MAFGRLERPRAPQPMSDINMTPLIDVMLVLLVIFIITAPLLSSSLRLDLPRVQGAPAAETPAVLHVALDAAGQLYLDDQPIDADALAEQATSAAERNPATEVQLRADASVPYGRVAELIGALQKAGLSRIGFITANLAAAAGAPAASAAR